MNIDFYLKKSALTGAFKSGNEPVIVLEGESLGSGPNVVLFDRMDGYHNYELPFNKKANIGRWTNFHGDAGYVPMLYEDLGRTWLSQRKADMLSSADRLNVGMFKSVGSAFSEFRFSQRRWVPVGKNFPGASSPATLPGASTWKPTWFAQNGAGNMDLNGYQIATKADLVIDTYPGGTFMVNGNSIQPQGTNNANGFSFTTPTFSSWYQKPIVGEVDGICENMYYNNLTQSRNITNNNPFNLQDPETPVDDESYEAFNFGAWMGNGNFVDCVPLLADCYLAIGPNSRACVLASSNSTLAASGHNVAIVPPAVWGASSVAIQPNNRERMGFYHLILADGTLLENVPWHYM